MKNYITCFILLLFASGFAMAQPSIEEVTKAMKAGNASEVAKYFDKVVDITINDEQSTYSRSQAEVVLKNFFSKHQIKSFGIKHQGSPADNNAIYLIGDLATSNGEKYRIYLYFRQRAGELQLQEVRFEQ